MNLGGTSLAAIQAHFVTLRQIFSSPIDPKRRKEFESNIVSASKGLVGFFPPPGGTWADQRIRVDLVEQALDILQLTADHVDALYAGRPSVVRLIATHLLSLCHTLDQWIDGGVFEDPEATSPAQLRARTIYTTTCFLRGFGGTVSLEDEQPHWKILQDLLKEWLSCCHDLMINAPAMSFPLQVTFFTPSRLAPAPKVAQIAQEGASLDEPLTITVLTASSIPLVLSLLLDLTCRVLCPSVLSQWFLMDVLRLTSTTARTIFDFTYSCVTTGRRRMRALASVVSSNTSLLTTNSGTADLRFRLLRWRLEGRDCPDEDLLIRQSILDVVVSSEVKSNVAILLELLQKVDLSRCALGAVYLGQCVARLDAETLASADAVLTIRATEARQAKHPSLEDISAALNGLKAVVVKLMEPPWRATLQTLVAEIVEPASVEWMEVEDDTEYAQNALDTIEERFTHPLHETSDESRIAIAVKLRKLAPILANNEGNQLELITLRAYTAAAMKLLEGEVEASVRREVYNALGQAALHQKPEDDEGQQAMETLVLDGMEDKNRTVRVAAGRAQAHLLSIYPAAGIPVIVKRISSFADMSKPTIRETAVLCLGAAGRSPRVLEYSVCSLIYQLGCANPIIKGTAYMQLLDLAKYHKKTQYQLLSPYLDHLSPYVLSRLISNPGLTLECRRFMLRSQAEFLTATVDRALPQLFCNMERKVLDQIAKEQGKMSASSLYIGACLPILAHAFMMPSKEATVKVLGFIIGVLSDSAAPSARIDSYTVVKSEVVALLATLVIETGSQDRARAALGHTALEKVVKIMMKQESCSVGKFLESHMLGVVSHITDTLQDAHGKKTMAAKVQCIDSLQELVKLVGEPVAAIGPQIMATLQNAIVIPELCDSAIKTWRDFLRQLEKSPTHLGAHMGPTSATLVALWDTFSSSGKKRAMQILEHLVTAAKTMGDFADDIVELSGIDQLSTLNEKLKRRRKNWTPHHIVQSIIARSANENATVASQSLVELRNYMTEDHGRAFIRNLATGDIFDPLIGQLVHALFAAACREEDESDTLRLLAFECIGILGAVDPDRSDFGSTDDRVIQSKNFEDKEEAQAFAIHLIKDVLVGAYRSASDTKHQSHLAFALQELLKLCGFKPSLAQPGRGDPPEKKVMKIWKELPEDVIVACTPLLDARYKLGTWQNDVVDHPIYPSQATYREWIQRWTTNLISKAAPGTAQSIFGVFLSAVRNKDVGVAHHLLPHLVLHVVMSGRGDGGTEIHSEIMAVLQDQVNADSTSTSDKKLLSAQVVFMLLDHLNKCLRVLRQRIAASSRRRSVELNMLQERAMHIDSLLLNLNADLMAKAALQCRAYARALMSSERHLTDLQEKKIKNTDPAYYERLHEIYAHLDEPDGMEGVSTLLPSPSLEHQIRQHESTGRWTSAQSCWEIRLQQSPDNLDFHLGLLRCLRNIGHYDTLRTHVKGVLTRNPQWAVPLVDFHVESAWMVGAWDDVELVLNQTEAPTSSTVIARVLLAMRAGDPDAIHASLKSARLVLGLPIVASGIKEYRRSYDSVLNLHLTHDLEIIHNSMAAIAANARLPSSQQTRSDTIRVLDRTLKSRFDATLPTFRYREPILSMCRTAFSIATSHRVTKLAGKQVAASWLASAKIARRAGQHQTAYSAMLQSQQSLSLVPWEFFERVKLLKSDGEPQRALQELENAMRKLNLSLLSAESDKHTIDITEENKLTPRNQAKAHILRARWMTESGRFDNTAVTPAFKNATAIAEKWESAYYYYGKYHDDIFKDLPQHDISSRGPQLQLQTIKHFASAIKFGSKFVYQTVPRLLTLWLDMKESTQLKEATTVVTIAIRETPVYKWYTAFPQIVSRIGHSDLSIYKGLNSLISTVVRTYPRQALWLFIAVIKSQISVRAERGKSILDALRHNPGGKPEVSALIAESLAMSNEFLALCDYRIDKQDELKMSKTFPKLYNRKASTLIIPVQESLTASLPPTTDEDEKADHQPFPEDVPTITGFYDDILIMKSLAKPRKVGIKGSDGHRYNFLGKPKDDLRKDARLMDFNTIINKLLAANSESRRRKLHIRTYGVVPLNEECGWLQWVDNTAPVRAILTELYRQKGKHSTFEGTDIIKTINHYNDVEIAKIWNKILISFPPVFRNWFIDTFPEPTAWLAGRLTYTRTVAVMSMVGFILGLGDRHTENILMDSSTGDLIHVDFNSLFEKAKQLEIPELVPFRLTQNMIDGMGVTGYEGAYRVGCELTMQTLRDNAASLMSILDAFIHDPLVEWAEDQRKADFEADKANGIYHRRHVPQKPKTATTFELPARKALGAIEEKLKGVYTTSFKMTPKETSTPNLVEMLIQAATDRQQLPRMYQGWTAWH